MAPTWLTAVAWVYLSICFACAGVIGYDIAVNPANSNVIYIGTAGGGAWRSDDGGASWFPLFDRQLSLAVGEPGALAIDPNNTDVVYLARKAPATR